MVIGSHATFPCKTLVQHITDCFQKLLFCCFIAIGVPSASGQVDKFIELAEVDISCLGIVILYQWRSLCAVF